MSKSIKLEAEKRDGTLNPREVRNKGLLTGTIYGKGVNSVHIQLDTKNFLSKYKASKDKVFNILVNKDSYEAKLVNLQKDHSKGKNLNVEFKLL